MLILLAQTEWRLLLGTTPLEVLATVSSIAGVFLIARQNVWGWPLGILWAAISTWLAFFEWHLLSDAILYASYIPIQIYCWLTWNAGDRGGSVFAPRWSSRRLQLALVVGAAVGVLLWGMAVDVVSKNVAWVPAPALLWRDASSTVLNYFGQFLQAKKRMENWLAWVMVNALGLHIYWVKGSPIYSFQYAVFLLLGIYGWVSWQRSARHALT